MRASDAATARATELVESLEHQIEALCVEMDEERVTGLKGGRQRRAAGGPAAGNAATANKLAGELEAYRREAYDFDAKQALTNLQLKAHEKVDALQEVVSEADARRRASAEKASKIAELTKKAESSLPQSRAGDAAGGNSSGSSRWPVAAAAKKKAMLDRTT